MQKLSINSKGEKEICLSGRSSEKKSVANPICEM
jgi:hypothetical protein